MAPLFSKRREEGDTKCDAHPKNRLAIAQLPRQPSAEEIAHNRYADHSEERSGHQFLFFFSGPCRNLRQRSQILRMPEQERPPTSQRKRADCNREQGCLQHLTLEEINNPRFLSRVTFGSVPFVRFG